MRYCSRCVCPSISVNTFFNEGICSACEVEEEYQNKTSEFWEGRKKLFSSIMDEYRSKNQSNYDCIVAVSGGKDSYWQTYVVKEMYGMNPLLVTYHGNNYLPEGQGNLDRMRDAFNVSHLVFGPGIDTLRKLNRIGFKMVGDMNWHAHAGIKITPIRIAVQMNIPLIIWGEVTWSISGMFSPDDIAEYNKRTVFEHDLRGFKWSDFINKGESLNPSELCWLRFPSDQEMQNVGVRGIYIGNYFKWEPNVHSKKMNNEYGFEFARQPFERTYRTMSNLDDMHENGIHDYMKFIKFGYGRATDHASKDIRQGYMTRAEGVKMVLKYDHVKPIRDLRRWLKYVGMEETEFDSIADEFRDPRVWWIQDGQWWKHTITGTPKAYGKVYLKDQEKIEFFMNNANKLQNKK